MSAVVSLGKLEAVSLRDAWPSEAANFTPWLAEDSNLQLLGETLGLQLELEAVEKAVGPFSADILARDIGTSRWVLIENQIEPTDHRHLGQLLTYAAGLDTHVVVWIAQSFREEHRAAIDFLNRATVEEFSFFGVQVELFRIGNSPLAPTFSLVAKPNNWSKQAQAGKQAAQDDLSPKQVLYREFWREVVEESPLKYPALSARPPYKTSWQHAEKLLTSPIVYADSNAAFASGRLRVEIYIGRSAAKAAFYALQSEKTAIERQFGHELEWEELPKGQDSRIAFYMQGAQRVDDKNSWSSQRQWILEHWQRLAETFRPHLKALDLSSLEMTDADDAEGIA